MRHPSLPHPQKTGLEAHENILGIPGEIEHDHPPVVPQFENPRAAFAYAAGCISVIGTRPCLR
jgi:hypothetical protein